MSGGSDGFEVHFYERRGYLRLACEPDAFAPYREILRDQLSGFPDIEADEIVELEIIDTATFVARRDAPRNRLRSGALIILILLVLGLSIVGLLSIGSTIL